VGSYDGTFYALDARSGGVRWSFRDGGAISGASTLLGGIVYFSNIRKRSTLGLDARTGRVRVRFPDGAYNPVVSDTRTIFLAGKKSLYALRPRRSPR
jgi:outer membrane protein assembly factor BamB